MAVAVAVAVAIAVFVVVVVAAVVVAIKTPSLLLPNTNKHQPSSPPALWPHPKVLEVATKRPGGCLGSIR